MTPTLTKLSTQHIGDGPPGNDDYYDPVGEENNRATGSSFNPNAAAWDPEKMELTRIVHRLLALKGRGELCLLRLPGQWSMLFPTR